MSRHAALPATDEVVAARDQLLADAAAGDARPTVIALARRLGLANTTFWRHYPDLARDLADARRTTDTKPAPVTSPPTRPLEPTATASPR